MNHQYSSLHQLESNSTRNKDLKKSYDDINKKLQNIQNDLQSVRLPLGGSDNYFLQGEDSQVSPIGSHLQTFGSTLARLDYPRNDSRPQFKSDSATMKRQSPMLQGASSVRNGNSSRRSNNSNKEAISPIGFSGTPTLLISDNGSLLKLNTASGDGSPKKGYSPLGFSGQNIGGNIKPKKKTDGKMTAEEVRGRLKKVFQFYTTYGDRCNTSGLKSNKFHKMMVDAGIRDQILSQRELDLIFVAENRHKSSMDYDTFLQLLVKIAEQKYQGAVPSSQALDKFLQEHILPLYNNIYRLSDTGIEEAKLKEPIIDRVLVVLRSVHVLLLKLYQTYFPWEVQATQQQSVIRQRDEVALFSLLRDFDVCPALMTKGAVTMIWTEVTETSPNDLSRNPKIESMIPFMEKDVGTLFTFSKFCTLLVRIASIVYNEYLQGFDLPIGQAEKLTMLLERMDMSSGMQEFEKKTCHTHNSKNSLLVPKNLLQKARTQEFDSHPNSIYTPAQRTTVGSNLPSENSDFSNIMKQSQGSIKVQRTASSASLHSSKTFNVSTQRSQMESSLYTGSASQLDNYEFEDPGVVTIFENNHESLTRVFQYYCSFGEPMNNTRLKSIKFGKMLKECGLLTGTKVHDQSFKGGQNMTRSQQGELINRSLTQTEADLMFASLTGLKHQKGTSQTSLKSSRMESVNQQSKNTSSTSQASGKLSFEGFLKAIETIAQKLLPDFEIAEAVQIITEKFLLRLDAQIAKNVADQRYTGGDSLKLLVDLLKDSEVVKFLNVVHKSMMVYYNFYADKNGLLNFEKFVQFCKDFSIFPDILSKARIKSFFQTLSSIHYQGEVLEKNLQNTSAINLQKSFSQSSVSSEQKSLRQSSEVVDQHLFIEGIALCAFEVSYKDPQPHSVYKISYLLEKMNQSQGPMIVQKAMGLTRSPIGGSWDIMFHIKQEYPDIYNLEKTENIGKKGNFNDLLGEQYE